MAEDNLNFYSHILLYNKQCLPRKYLVCIDMQHAYSKPLYCDTGQPIMARAGCEAKASTGLMHSLSESLITFLCAQNRSSFIQVLLSNIDQ